MISYQKLKPYYYPLLCGLLLLLSFFYPIYPDEITNIFLVGRNGLEANIKLWLTPACIASPIFIPAPLLYIYSFLQVIFNQISNHRDLRLASLVYSIALFGFWFRLAWTKGNRNNLSLIFLIFLLPAVFVNSFVYLRPEKYLLTFLIFSVYLHTARNKEIILSAIYTAILALALINHPKAFYFLPLYFFSLYSHVDAGDYLKIFFKAIFGSFALILAYQCYKVSTLTWICEPIEYIRIFVANYALDPTLLLSDPANFFRKIIFFNDWNHSYRAISQVFIRSAYDIGYLPNFFNAKALYLTLNLPILYLIGKTFFKLTLSMTIFDGKVFYLIYFFTIALIYIFSGNKGAYDIAFVITALLAIIPFVVTKKIEFSKNILMFTVIVVVYAYICIVFNLIQGWTGPGIRLTRGIDYEAVKIKADKHASEYQSILYEDNTAFMFNDVANKYPITYTMNLATLENHLVRKNLKDPPYLFVGGCGYLSNMAALQPDLRISNFEKFRVRGIDDYVCVSEIK